MEIPTAGSTEPMPSIKFQYEVSGLIRLELAEIEKYLGWCANHHSSLCRNAGQVGGFLVSWCLSTKYKGPGIAVNNDMAYTMYLLCQGEDDKLAHRWACLAEQLRKEEERINA